MDSYLYLDHNATTYVEEDVLDVVQKLSDKPLNPSSIHQWGREGRFLVDRARGILHDKLHASPSRYDIFFTATGTEANNLAFSAFPDATRILSVIEHPSLLVCGENNHVEWIPVDIRGVVSMEMLEDKLKKATKPCFVSVIFANNETGVIQPIKDMVRLVHEYGGIFHTDAVQVLGKIPCNIDDIGADMLTISAHKCGGLAGAAALIVSSSLPTKPRPQLFGGGQEKGMRPGTENVRSIIGFSESLKVLDDKVRIMSSLALLRDEMEEELMTYGAVVHGKQSQRLPNTSFLAMPYVPAETQCIHFDLENIGVSAGSACSSGKVSSSHVLKQMGVVEELAVSSIRVSLGWNTTREDVERFIRVWKTICQRAGGKHEGA